MGWLCEIETVFPIFLSGFLLTEQTIFYYAACQC